MIITKDKYPGVEPKFVVDLGTPFEPEDCDHCINIIENSSCEMLVNSIYDLFKEGHETGRRLYRPGFKFMFWFYDRESAEQFCDATETPGYRCQVVEL